MWSALRQPRHLVHDHGLRYGMAVRRLGVADLKPYLSDQAAWWVAGSR
jgi:hypothetical protein